MPPTQCTGAQQKKRVYACPLLRVCCPILWREVNKQTAVNTCAGQQQHPDPFRHIADEYRQIKAVKTHAKLVDPAELPRRQKGVRRVDEGFWRQSTSSYAAPSAAKKRRKQTLERAPRKAVRVAKPDRQAVISQLAQTTQSRWCTTYSCRSAHPVVICTSVWHCTQARIPPLSA